MCETFLCLKSYSNMRIDLSQIKLKLKWVNMRSDNTDREVSLLQIAKMDYEQRKLLTWVDDFHPKYYKFVNNFDFTDSLEFTRLCDHIGYIHFCFTNHLGVFYEAVYETKDEDLFNKIRVTYFETLQTLYP
jgi:hypothetical protein